MEIKKKSTIFIIGTILLTWGVLSFDLTSDTQREIKVGVIKPPTIEKPTQATEKAHRKELEVCSTNTFKSYMGYEAITDTTSKQWELQQEAETESSYGLRMLNDYFMIAVTSRYGQVGDVLEIDFQGGSMLAIIGDIKSDGHDSCQSTRDGSVVEFIIDSEKLHPTIRKLGDLNVLFKGSIKTIHNLGSYN